MANIFSLFFPALSSSSFTADLSVLWWYPTHQNFYPPYTRWAPLSHKKKALVIGELSCTFFLMLLFDGVPSHHPITLHGRGSWPVTLSSCAARDHAPGVGSRGGRKSRQAAACAGWCGHVALDEASIDPRWGWIAWPVLRRGFSPVIHIFIYLERIFW